MLPGVVGPTGGLGGVVSGGGGGSDPDFSSVVLLMGFEGSNGSTSAPGFSDESPAAHGVLTSDNPLFANVSTAQKKFGSSSLNLNGDFAYYPSSADWQFGSSHFTIEMFLRPGTVSGTQYILSTWNTTGDYGWVLFLSGNKLCWATSEDGSATFLDITGATSLVTGTWQNITIDYDGSKYRTYVDGVMDGSFSTPRTLFNSPDHLTIGAAQNGLNALTAFIDELRITKGVARYASDGGFTVPTAAFPRS